MIFEVSNLDYASPATISRCGIIYITSKIIGREEILESWRIKFLCKQMNVKYDGYERININLLEAIKGAEKRILDFFNINFDIIERDFYKIINVNE